MTVSESLRRTGQAEPGSNQAANALHQATATPPLPGDMDTLRELFDPEIVWHFPGRSPLAGDHRGTDVVLGFFGRTMELTAGTLRVELSVHDVVADDRHTVGMHLGTGEREGRRFEDRGPGVPRPRRQSCGGVAVHRGPVHLRRVLLPGAAAAPRPLLVHGRYTAVGQLGERYGHQRSPAVRRNTRSTALSGHSQATLPRRARVRVSRPAAASLWLLATVQSSSRTGLTLR